MYSTKSLLVTSSRLKEETHSSTTFATSVSPVHLQGVYVDQKWMCWEGELDTFFEYLLTYLLTFYFLPCKLYTAKKKPFRHLHAQVLVVPHQENQSWNHGMLDGGFNLVVVQLKCQTFILLRFWEVSAVFGSTCTKKNNHELTKL